MEIKIDAKTVISNEGGFEPHPESYTPRVFAAIMPPANMAGAPNGDDPKVYEILMNGQAIPWPCLPILECFDYWVLYVEHLSDVNMCRQERFAKAPVVPPAVFEALSQADGYAERESGTPTWIGEVDGKKYNGLGKLEFTPCGGKYCNGEPCQGPPSCPESGDLSHLPEGSH